MRKDVTEKDEKHDVQNSSMSSRFNVSGSTPPPFMNRLFFQSHGKEDTPEDEMNSTMKSRIAATMMDDSTSVSPSQNKFFFMGSMDSNNNVDTKRASLVKRARFIPQFVNCSTPSFLPSAVSTPAVPAPTQPRSVDKYCRKPLWEYGQPSAVSTPAVAVAASTQSKSVDKYCRKPLWSYGPREEIPKHKACRKPLWEY